MFKKDDFGAFYWLSIASNTVAGLQKNIKDFFFFLKKMFAAIQEQMNSNKLLQFVGLVICWTLKKAVDKRKS